VNSTIAVSIDVLSDEKLLVMADEAARPRVGVSSCLLGAEVRFNGGHKRSRFLTDELGPYVDWVPYCPEVEIGLGTPREPIRLTFAGRLVNRGGTLDHTEVMGQLPLVHGLDGYVFKAKSPSCGVFSVARYRADGELFDHAGRGLYAARVLSEFPLLAAEDEGRLNDPGLREAFVERIFAAARLRGLFSRAWEVRELVSFHARHKLQLLAHDPERYGEAGRIVAAAGAYGAYGASGGSSASGACGASGASGVSVEASRASVGAAYEAVFLAALGGQATRGRTANALQHAYSRIGRELDQARRGDLVARIDAYRLGQEPLSVPVALLAHYASSGQWPWLAEQTFLAPFPAGLRLRHSV
jgi:uncharacterized protein YbbK (DUF523 family)/uncharacterized protein YbgA (DUF1722 family)